jgi:hypothetical protein
MEIVPAFREANKLQIVNTVFLTDGQSSGNSLPYGSTYYKTKAYITDPATRKTYEVTDSDSGSITSTLLRIFRDRTKTNAIGFYITYGKSLPITHPWQVNDVRDDKAFSDASASWRDNGFAVALPNAGGYTEWYIVCSTDLKVDASNDALSRVVNGGGSVASVTKALLKDAKAKNKSKLIVGRFINLIAK